MPMEREVGPNASGSTGQPFKACPSSTFSPLSQTTAAAPSLPGSERPAHFLENIMNATNSRTADKFVVRLPDGMREQVAEVARKNHRSMNSEIIDRLEQSLLNAQFESAQQMLDGSLNAEELKAELTRAYRVIDRLLQNAVPTQDDIQEVLHLVRKQTPLAHPHIAAVGA